MIADNGGGIIPASTELSDPIMFSLDKSGFFISRSMSCMATSSPPVGGGKLRRGRFLLDSRSLPEAKKVPSASVLGIESADELIRDLDEAELDIGSADGGSIFVGLPPVKTEVVL